ncbi:MAG: hypothetical protein ACE5EM_13420, partial [Sphingomonadales bacterium]
MLWIRLLSLEDERRGYTKHLPPSTVVSGGLFALEIGRSLVDERLHSLGLIGGREQGVEQAALEADALG